MLSALKIKYFLFILAGLFVFSLNSCGNVEGSNSVDSPLGTAKIILDNGKEFEFKATFDSGITAQQNKLGIGLSNSLNGVMVYVMFLSPDVMKKGESDGYISLKQLLDDNILDEDYNTHYYTNQETGQTGSSQLEITSVDENKITGTFSGTLFSKSGKKVEIKEGKFNIEVDNNF